MLAPPLLDASHIGGAFEVILVLWFTQPPGLGLALALGTTERLETKALVATIARIQSKEALAMQALTKASGQRHSGGKKTHPTGERHSELRPTDPSGKKIREENGRRRKKKFS